MLLYKRPKYTCVELAREQRPSKDWDEGQRPTDTDTVSSLRPGRSNIPRMQASRLMSHQDLIRSRLPPAHETGNAPQRGTTWHSERLRPKRVKSSRGPYSTVPSFLKIAMVCPLECEMEKCVPSTSPMRKFPNCMKRSPKPIPRGSPIWRAKTFQSVRGPGCSVPSPEEGRGNVTQGSYKSLDPGESSAPS